MTRTKDKKMSLFRRIGVAATVVAVFAGVDRFLGRTAADSPRLSRSANIFADLLRPDEKTAPPRRTAKARIDRKARPKPKPAIAYLPPASVSVGDFSSTTVSDAPVMRRPAAISAEKLLVETVISADYLEMPLEDVIADLRERLGINIVAFWPAIESAGISRIEPVTFTVEDVSASAVLKLVLESASSGRTRRLGYQLTGGIVRIDLKENLTDQQRTVVYYVGDLIDRRSDLLDGGILVDPGGGTSTTGSAGRDNPRSP